MIKQAPDQLVRDIAIDYKQSFIVQAPAGAGKTSLLTQRILNLLTVVENPEEVVAVTFTRKAAAEMRHRLLEALESVHAEEPELAHEKVSWNLAKQVAERDLEKQWQLSKNPNRLCILTIDSLSSLIANQMPLMSHLGGSLGISEFPQDSYQTAASAVLGYINDDEYSEDITLLVAHLDNQVEKLIGLLAKMLSKRDQWLRLLGAGDLDIGILQQGLIEVANFRLQALEPFIPLIRNSSLLSGIHFAEGFIDADHALSALKEVEQLPELNADHLIQWKAIADFCLTTSGTFRKSLNKNQGLLADKDLEGEDKVVGKQIKNDLKALFEEWQEVQGFAEMLADINQFPLAAYTEQQQRILVSLLKLLRLATIQLNVDFQSRSEADFIEVALAADRALGYFDEPSELALKLDYQISHILVDEFQDTSFTQYRLLNKLIAGWQQGDGRTLFLVGDPMQSIYRFREANVGLFIKTQNEGIGDINIEPLTLTANFRSSDAIIDWVNKHFNSIFPVKSDALLGAVNYSAADAMKDKESGDGVEFLVSFDESNVSEAERIALEIKQLKAEDSKQSIAILVRGRTHAEPIAQALAGEGIGFYAKDMQLLSFKAVIADLLAMTRFILQPNDGIGLVALLKSPYVGLSLKDITELHHEFGPRYLQYFYAFNEVGTLSTDANQKLQKVVVSIIHAIESAGRKPLSQIIETLWLNLGGPSALLDSQGLVEAEAFFKVLMELEQGQSISDIEVVETALLKLYAEQKKSADDVEIMTMHKSKGLEFDTVFLPSLERGKRADDHQLLLWEEFSSGYEQHYLLAPIQAQESKEPIYQLARDIQNKKSQFEDARLLYVAATRAKQRLYLSCELKTKYDEKKDEWKYNAISKKSLLHYLAPFYQTQIQQEFDELEIDLDDVDITESEQNSWYRLAKNYQHPEIHTELRMPSELIEESSSEIDFDWASDLARVVGLVTHQILEWVGNGQISFSQLEATNYQTIKSMLSEHLMEQSEQQQALAKIQKALELMQNDSNLSWILQPHKNAVNEWPISQRIEKDGQIEIINMIIDRSFIDENGVRWIIDYKTGEHLGGDLNKFFDSEKERYQPQLDKYELAVKQLDSRNIKKVLYYPIHQTLLELE